MEISDIILNDDYSWDVLEQLSNACILIYDKDNQIFYHHKNSQYLNSKWVFCYFMGNSVPIKLKNYCVVRHNLDKILKPQYPKLSLDKIESCGQIISTNLPRLSHKSPIKIQEQLHDREQRL